MARISRTRTLVPTTSFRWYQMPNGKKVLQQMCWENGKQVWENIPVYIPLPKIKIRS